MKKTILILMTILVLISAAGCGNTIRTEKAVFSLAPEKEAVKYGLTEEQIGAIRTIQYNGILKYLKRYSLNAFDLTEESIQIIWEVADKGKIIARTEVIAFVTEETRKNYGCGDHAHVFAEIPIVISEDTVTVLPGTVTGN